MSAPLDVLACPLSGTTLIEASAGTGKTWAICGLVLRLIAEAGLPIDAILVVTFTNAATAELKTRIRERLGGLLAIIDAPPDAVPETGDRFARDFLTHATRRGLAPETLRERLAAALTCFDQAAIHTIHGFCQRALGDVPVAAAQPFVQELGDTEPLLSEIAADFWRSRIAHADLSPDFIDWLLAGNLTPDLLTRLLRQRLARPLARLRWPETGNTATGDDISLEQAFTAAGRIWQHAAQAPRDTLLAALPTLHGSTHNEARIRDGAAAWETIFRTGEIPDQLPTALNQYRQSRIRVKGNHAKPQHPFFNAAETLLAAHEARLEKFAAGAQALKQQFLDWAPAEYHARRRERRLQGFDDLLADLHEVLAGAAGDNLAGALRRRYRAALIDEFQDTDPLQFAVFARLYAGRDEPLILVGDPKQAIYAFRQADLQTYLHARQSVAAHYTLSANQRSLPVLIESLNALFSANPQAFMLPGLAYEAATAGSRPRRDWASACVPPGLQLWQLPSGDGLMTHDQATAACAKATAGEIARLLAAGRQGTLLLDGQPLAARDIAILVRTHAQGQLVQRALAEIGLAAAILSPESVFRSSEAQELELLLRAVVEPTRPERLKAGLATSLMGLDAGDLLALDDDEGALAGWIERHADWRQLWRGRGIARLVHRLMHDAGLAARLLAGPSGERRLTNLRHLVELLHRAEAQHASPELLLGWLSSQRAEPRDDDAAQLRLDSDSQLVSIVTIHKAKGLQYPVVFCPFVWEGGLRRQAGAGLGNPGHDAEGRQVLDYGEVDVAAARLELAAERIRLLYVALTRAEHRLYVVYGPYLRHPGGKPSQAESNKSLLNWLVAGGNQSPGDWLATGGGPEEIAAAWQEFAARCPSGPARLPVEPATPCDHEGASTPLLARSMPRHLASGWRLDSFSGLLRSSTRDESAAREHDQQVVDHPPEAALAPSASEGIFLFPKGPQAGDCIHAVFEYADFTDPATWDTAIARALSLYPPGGNFSPEILAMQLRGMLADVVSTPLRPALRLAGIPPARRISEMEFTLPCERLDATALQNLLVRHGIALPALAFAPLHGWLKGFIDLVFEHDGRYYLADWKSNHLGSTPADYATTPLAEAMTEHGYALQALLYQVALHRHLACRLRDYDPNRHLGGALYLFVRGMRPAWPGAGIVHRPFNGPLIDELSRWMGS